MKENTLTIESLRKNGYKTRVSHHRIVNRLIINNNGYKVENQLLPVKLAKSLCNESSVFNRLSAKGGTTLVEITDTKTGKEYEHLALCHTENDNFCYKDGVAECLDNIVKENMDDFSHLIS